jgi:hypothetical protein
MGLISIMSVFGGQGLRAKDVHGNKAIATCHLPYPYRCELVEAKVATKQLR